MSEEADNKIIRNPDNLLIKVAEEELLYRNKYLSDLKKLTNEKLVCTVCSKSLAASVHKGGDIFVHRFLQVLVCENCYTFYGDGCFSCDEDGDDKYCRWCGQGGDLFLCSSCTCAFCQSCVKQNLKASVLAELDNDDWKCYICNPRPLFGTRTICWGAQELNKIGKEKELERIQKLKEKQDKINENRKKENERKSRKDLERGESSKTKRKRASDNDSTSPEVLPSKRSRRDRSSVNGSVGQRRTRRTNSSSDDLDKKRGARSLKKSYLESSSEDDSDSKNKTKNKFKNKKVRESSSEMSETDRKESNIRKTTHSIVDSSDDGKRTKRNRSTRKQEKNSSDDSRDEKSVKKKKKVTDNDSSSDDENNKKLKKVRRKNKMGSLETEGSSSANSRGSKMKLSLKKSKESETDGDELVGKTKSNLKSTETLSPEELIIKKRIKLAILWLSNTVKDIGELGALISVRAKKFEKKKINTENLKTYEDVISTVTQLKQLISGVHSNYEHIEQNLDAQLKPWKVLIGKDSIDSSIPVKETSTDNIQSKKNILPESKDKLTSSSANNSHEKVRDHESEKKEKIQSQEPYSNDCELHFSGESSDESDNKDSRDLITKVNESLDRMDELEATNECNKESSELESKSLKEKDAKESYNTSELEKSIDENSKSSKALENNLDSEEPLNTEKVINQSTPKKKFHKEESERSKKSTKIVKETSGSDADTDELPKKNSKEDSRKNSKGKSRKQTKGESEKLEKKSESTGQ